MENVCLLFCPCLYINNSMFPADILDFKLTLDGTMTDQQALDGSQANEQLKDELGKTVSIPINYLFISSIHQFNILLYTNVTQH